MNIKEASKVIFEAENEDFFRGYNYANVQFVGWFWDVVNGKRCSGAMQPEIQEVRDWIITHKETT